ncbi:MAG: histidinol-phosphate transaminase [Ferruginibacter sp.]
MTDINQLVRQNILHMHPYSSARKEYKGSEGIFVDANENPFGKYNRYPDGEQSQLKQAISKVKNIVVKNIFLGNGSDEIIDLLFRIFCRPGVDKVISFTPTYGMYEVSAALNDVEIIEIPLTKDFQPDLNILQKYVNDESCKLLFICSPNNPTGNLMDQKLVTEMLQKFNGIVVIDEAYIDFCDEESFANKIDQYPNLVVLQTLSKAWGLAALRIGIGFSAEAIIDLLNKVKPPYNISTANQQGALKALENIKEFETTLEILKQERKKLSMALKDIDCIKKVYPTDANFFLVEVTDANKIYQQLISQKIIVRNRNSVLKNCLRISIGTPEENDILIKALKQL